MRPPAFWFTAPDQPALPARLLSPLAALYAKATAKRVTKNGTRVDVPVICVGNLNAGGTGKTPTVIALAQRLSERGLITHVVSRGYGGRLQGPVMVDAKTHSAADVGDEPLLISAFTPCWVSKDRLAGAQKAVSAGAQAVLLDDGFQNPFLTKDISIIVVDAVKGFGNGRVLPAGPLREPVKAGLKRADFILSIGPDASQAKFVETWGEQITIPHLQGTLQPLPLGMDWADTKVIAFAGIGHPEKFFNTLHEAGADILRTVALDDHQPLSTTLLQRLENEATQIGAQLVTTEKDAVRLPKEYRQKVLTFPVRLNIKNWRPLDAALDNLFSGKA